MSWTSSERVMYVQFTSCVQCGLKPGSYIFQEIACCSRKNFFYNIYCYIQFSVLIYQFNLIYSVFCFEFWTPAIVEMPCMNSLLLFRTSVRLFICNARSRKFLIIFFCSFFFFFARSQRAIPANIHLFKVNNKNIRNYVVLVPLLLTLNIFHIFFWCFYC